ncbi:MULTISPECIES: hypothetical protein [Metallosphaera]|uniref:hypothetical protein n=1 Tax=Metallosphaera TaxID=41980 RepID=UPI0000E96FE5|nr:MULTISPECIES: hypothetical protein [Metallosphaera]MCY0861693.1 hypothetical protein [Metallosphaera prunae]WPX05250.1 hypothetical protein SOJ17_001213 [Metallosphaera sedula DSM 5348]BBL47339.1 UV DNA damage endonuclease [Metallosphaera sedula]
MNEHDIISRLKVKNLDVNSALKLKFKLRTAVNFVKIGYVSTNYSLDCRADATFRLKSLTETKVLETASSNLNCLKRILAWNVEHGILFFRISSNTIPFASHPKNTTNWRDELRDLLKEIGSYVRNNGIRVSMHPGQYTVINSERREIIEASIKELEYHADLLDLMGESRGIFRYTLEAGPVGRKGVSRGS